MDSTPRKRGRPQAKYRMADGTEILGLSRHADNRWRVSTTGEVFFEDDECLAVQKFLTHYAPKPKTVDFQVLPRQPNESPVTLVSFDHTPGKEKATQHFPEAAIWAWVREQVITRPQYVAQMTGIEQIGYLDKIAKPSEAPTLEALGELYYKKAMSPNELGRSKLFWGEFEKALGVKTIREITHEVVAQYEKKTLGRGLSPKSILHRYRKIRSVFHHAIRRGQSPDLCRRALDVLAMLEVKGTQTLDPTPISPEEFWRIYGAAMNAGDEVFAALLLTALNCGMCGGEVAALKWEEVNLKTGGLVTRRPKIKVSRIAVLWPETIRSLRGLTRHGEYLFYTRIRSFTIYSVGDRFERYRDAARVPKDRTFEWIRDAAFTEACKISSDQARMLAGQRVPGVSDHYLRRRPDLVAEACKLIARVFKVAKHVR